MNFLRYPLIVPKIDLYFLVSLKFLAVYRITVLLDLAYCEENTLLVLVFSFLWLINFFVIGILNLR